MAPPCFACETLIGLPASTGRHTHLVEEPVEAIAPPGNFKLYKCEDCGSLLVRQKPPVRDAVWTFYKLS